MDSEKLNRLFPQLQRIANQMYAYYGGPVYLIGSILEKDSARDIDIRVVVSREDFERLYGKFEEFSEQYSSGNFGSVAWRWADDRLKRCRQFSKDLGENVDFCCFDETMWQPTTTYKRLDTRELYDSQKQDKAA